MIPLRVLKQLSPWMLVAMAGGPSLHAQTDLTTPARPPNPPAAVAARWGTQANLGPLYTRLAVIDGVTLQRGQAVQAEVELCNTTNVGIEGRVSILSTAAWQARPGRIFPFNLGPNGTCFKQHFQLSLFDAASPGPYDLVLRVEANGDELGTLRTRFMRPVEWLVIGPFPAATPGELLPPEWGVQLEGTHPGLEGPVRWQRPAAWAYDATGALEVDLVLGTSTTPRCACAFTIFDLSEGETLRWNAAGTERLLLDGSPLVMAKPVRVTPGRHTLLARLCGRDAAWRLGLTLLREDGTWPRNLENDLERFLPGFGRTWGAEDATPTLRHVVLQVRQRAAREVSVLGTFNAWVPWKLERAGDLWKRDLVLAPGRHAYKLRIDGVIGPDASAERSEPDGFGGVNSLLIVR